MNILDIIKFLHLDEFFKWAVIRKYDDDIFPRIKELKTLNEFSFIFGQKSEKLLRDLLKEFYDKFYPGLYVVKHISEKMVEIGYVGHDALADSTLGDILVNSTSDDLTYYIDVKSAIKNAFGSISDPSPKNFGSKEGAGEKQLMYLKNKYAYDHESSLDRHIYFITHYDLDNALVAKASAVYNNYDKLKRYFLKDKALITTDTKRGYRNPNDIGRKEMLVPISGIKDALVQNEEWAYL